MNLAEFGLELLSDSRIQAIAAERCGAVEIPTRSTSTEEVLHAMSIYWALGPGMEANRTWSLSSYSFGLTGKKDI